jgi:hypothetical protein
MSRAPTVPTIRRSGRTGRTQIDHALVTRASRARQFVLGERRDDEPGLMVFTRAPRLNLVEGTYRALDLFRWAEAEFKL